MLVRASPPSERDLLSLLLSYDERQVARDVEGVAHSLAEIGVQPGDVVGLYSPLRRHPHLALMYRRMVSMRGVGV